MFANRREYVSTGHVAHVVPLSLKPPAQAQRSPSAVATLVAPSMQPQPFTVLTLVTPAVVEKAGHRWQMDLAEILFITIKICKK